MMNLSGVDGIDSPLKAGQAPIVTNENNVPIVQPKFVGKGYGAILKGMVQLRLRKGKLMDTTQASKIL